MPQASKRTAAALVYLTVWAIFLRFFPKSNDSAGETNERRWPSLTNTLAICAYIARGVSRGRAGLRVELTPTARKFTNRLGEISL
jgi:hypothetical protein